MKVNTVIKAKHASYQTKADEALNLRVQNANNVLADTSPKNITFRVTDHEFEVIAKICKQAFGANRLKELNAKEERLSWINYLSPEGKVSEIEFVIRGLHTSITIDELENLEKALKNSLSFNLSWENKKDANFAYAISSLPFSTIIKLSGIETANSNIIDVILSPPPSENK